MGAGSGAAMAAASDIKLSIMPLGAGREVGRSCVLLQLGGKSILLDCGIHPGYRGLASLPFFDVVDLEQIDLVLISHFHLDHIGSLPFLMQKTQFRGKVYMTMASKAIGALLVKDLIRVSSMSTEDNLFDERDLNESFARVEQIDFHQTIEVDGIKFTAYHAGHVLGGAMFLIEVGGVKVMYTGDYSREEDRHLPAAEVPHAIPDVLICEATYGKQIHEPRIQREERFTRLIRDIVMRGGRVLLPVFASGRAQELLLILDEYWEANPDLQRFPVYYASALAERCMQYYQRFINMMNNKVRKDFLVRNPFKFKHIRNLRSIEQFDDIGPCVMMASPGMLQSGMSRELFERWCPDRKNGVIIAGYSVEGTLAKKILHNPRDIEAQDGRRLPLNMSVEYISFSAHVDYEQNAGFIKQVDPPHLVLVHGEEHEMNRLKSALEKEFEVLGRKTQIHMPRNCETIELSFKGERTTKVVGSLAAAIEAAQSDTSDDVRGILLTKTFQSEIVAPADLAEVSPLTTSTVAQRLVVRLPRALFGRLHSELARVLEDVSAVDGKDKLIVYGDIQLSQMDDDGLLVEWFGDPFRDVAVDAIISLALRVEQQAAREAARSPPAATKAAAEHKPVSVKEEAVDNMAF